MNDPFELRPLFKSLYSKEFFIQQWVGKSLVDMPTLLLDARMMYEHQPPEFKQQVSRDELPAFISQNLLTPDGRAAIWTLVGPLLEDLVEPSDVVKGELLDHLSSVGGILSLTEVPDSVVMWAHYAANHTGFLIVFNDGHSYFHGHQPRPEFMHLRPVQYRESVVHSSLSGLAPEELFFTKKTDWSYEKEWRMVAPVFLADRVVNEAAEPIYLFAFPSECVEGVIVGARASPQLIAELRDLKSHDPRYRHLSLAQARLDADLAEVRISSMDSH